MKAALNGGLNLSILDGWWDEWYDGENGWAIPTADGVDDPEHRDDLEAAALYDLIESSVAPRFYDRDERGPAGAVARDGPAHPVVPRPKVLATRMVADYVTKLYIPAAVSERAATVAFAAEQLRRVQDAGAGGSGPRCGSTTSSRSGVSDSPQVGDEIDVRAFVTLGEQISPEDVDVQLVYGRVSAVRHPDRPGRPRRCSTSRSTRPAGTGSRAPSSCGGPARSATRSGCCRDVEGAASPAELGLVDQRLLTSALTSP